MYTALSLCALGGITRHPGSSTSPLTELTQLTQELTLLQNSRRDSLCLDLLQIHNRTNIVVDNHPHNKQLYGSTRHRK